MSMKQRFKPESVRASSAPALQIVQDDPAAPAKPKFSLQTLAQLGPNLPIGVSIPGGERSRAFRVRPYKMKHEKALAELRNEAKGVNIGKFVADVLALMLQTVGPHNFDTMKDGDRQLAINQLSMPDVLYLYLYLRYDALGDEPVMMQVKCPNCSDEYRWYGDLGTLEVKVITDGTSDLTRIYSMRDKMAFRGKEVDKLKLGLIKWDAFQRPEFQKVSSMQNATITASIIGIEGLEYVPGTFQMASDDLDDMSKYDMAGLIRDIEENTPGPQLAVEPQCPTCKYEARMMIDWSWDSFFARSARPSQ